MKKQMKKSGFTLVEIMIVVAIIGLLAAIGIPSFQAARTSARSKACLNNLRMLESGAEQYMMLKNTLTADVDDAAVYVKGGIPTCPSTNTEDYSVAGGIATCGTHGTIEAPLAAAQ